MFDTREPSIEALRAAPVKFRYGSQKRRILAGWHAGSGDTNEGAR